MDLHKKEYQFMYESTKTAEIIKNIAKSKGIYLKDMLCNNLISIKTPFQTCIMGLCLKAIA